MVQIIERKIGESIQAGPVTITVKAFRGKSRVRLAIHAPQDMKVTRSPKITPAPTDLEQTLQQIDQGD